MTAPMHVRWLGRVPYAEALTLQRALFTHGRQSHLLLLEHPHVYTLGIRADLANVLVDPASVGAELVKADRGGDVTYHGPGQLVGYPVLALPTRRGGMTEQVTYVRAVEQLLIDVLTELGLSDVGRLDDYPGVWVEPDGPNPRKIAAIGVKVSRGRTMHGFALNVATDLSMFGHIIPCGIPGRPVTSLQAEGLDVSLRDVVDVAARLAGERWGGVSSDRAEVAWYERPDDLSAFSRGAGPGDVVKRQVALDGFDQPTAPKAGEGPQPVRLMGRMQRAGVDSGMELAARKPDWMRAKANFGPEYLALKSLVRELNLTTVCEDAGCPNISECWTDGTATFMVNGERCTRACGFCLVDTRKPEPLDADEPARVAEAVVRMGLSHAVITVTARDDLADGGASGVAATVTAIRERSPLTKIETLISDCKGDGASLDAIFASKPDVLNHNIETVARLQRAVRPSAGYARSLGVLARAKQAGLITKSGIIVGMGETDDEVIETLHDLAGIGVDIVTIGQYLRPTTNHLPIHRWVTPEQFVQYRVVGESLGIGHVESSPLTRSSYHARQAADGVV
jgi:lipoyl synthase